MKHLLLLISSLAFICATRAEQQLPRKIVLKVNIGGGAVADFLAEEQVLETEGLHKTSTKETIKNTEQQEIFQTQRFSRHEDFVIRIPVSDGIYSVTLLFAEIYKKACTPRGRVFDISFGTPISGVTKVVEDFDLFQAAGCTSAYGRRFDKVPSKDGIVIHLKKKNQHPSLSGFIVEGYPLPKGDGSEYKPVGQSQSEEGTTGTNGGNDSLATGATEPLGASAPTALDTHLQGAQPVSQLQGGTSPPIEPPSALSEVGSGVADTQPGMVGVQPSMAGVQPGIAGMQPRMAGMQPELAGVQPANDKPMTIDGQQETSIAHQHQMQGQISDTGQSNIARADTMQPLPGQLPQMAGSPEMMQHPRMGGAVEQQVHRISST